MIDKMIVDADLCIKLGSSNKYKFLYEVLPLVADKIYMHTYVHSEIMTPESAVLQLQNLISEGKVILVNENNLDNKSKAVYNIAFKSLSNVMIDPTRQSKNKGEVCSLAYAKATGIPVFATDEKDLQSIIDKLLNTGMDDIKCIRILDIINMAKNSEISIARKIAKVLWVISGKEKEEFDKEIWSMIKE